MTTKTVGNNRLLKLAEYLDTIPNKEFKMDSWMGKRTGDYFSRKYIDQKFVKQGVCHNIRKLTSECGYAACAVGHAAGIPAFRKAGFKLVPTYSGWMDPMYGEHLNWDAVEEFFALNYSDAQHLFAEDSYNNPRLRPTTVANRIRKFVKDHPNGTL